MDINTQTALAIIMHPIARLGTHYSSLFTDESAKECQFVICELCNDVSLTYLRMKKILPDVTGLLLIYASLTKLLISIREFEGGNMEEHVGIVQEAINSVEKIIDDMNLL